MSGLRIDGFYSMILRCNLIGVVNIQAGDPQAILANKDTLGLTPKQVETIQGILNKARKDAEKTLNEDQRNKLKPLAATPNTMREMWQQMMKTTNDSGTYLDVPLDVLILKGTVRRVLFN